MQIVAALGSSGRAPLLAEGAGVRAVLHRAPPPALERVEHPGVWPCTGTLEVDGQLRGVYAYHPGADLAQVVGQLPDGLPGPWAEAVAGDLLDAVDALAPHGLCPVVREEALRIGVDGVARIVEVKKGEGAREALADLFERLVVETDSERIADAIARGDRDALAGARRPVPDVTPRFDTALALGAAKDTGAPPKLVVARIGVLLLALGLAMGWMLAPRSGSAVHVQVPGAQEVSLACQGDTCTVIASFAVGRASGSVDVSRADRYVCARTDGILECTAFSP